MAKQWRRRDWRPGGAWRRDSEGSSSGSRTRIPSSPHSGSTDPTRSDDEPLISSAGAGRDGRRRASHTSTFSPSAEPQSVESFRRRSPSVADWVRSSASADQGRADVRAMLRETRHVSASDMRLTDPHLGGLGLTSGPRDGGSWSSVGSLTTRRLSFQMPHSHDSRSSDEDSVSYLDAVGPREAGDPSVGLERHRCELPEDQILDPFPPLPPHPSWGQKFQRAVQPCLMLSKYHPETQRLLRSIAVTREEQSRHACSRHWYIIHPLSLIRLWWERILAIFIMASLMMIPIQLAFFKDIGKPYGGDATKSPYFWSWDVAVSFMDWLCLADCLLNFFTGYYVAHENVTVLHPRLIARRYLRSYFIIDFIPSIPQHWVVSPHPQAEIQSLETVLHVLRLVRLRRLLNYSDTWLSIPGCPAAIRKGLRFVIIVSIYLHWMSLAQWFVPLTMYGREELYNHTGAGNESWMVVNDILEYPVADKYLHCMYRAVTLSLRVSLPHAPPHTIADILVTTFNAITGLILYACCFVWVMFIILYRESNFIVYEQLMIMIRDYADYKQLTDELRDRLFQFYECSLQNSYFHESVIKDNLSRHLQSQVLQHACREAVRSSGLFHGMPSAVCTELVGYLRPLLLLRGDVFVRYGDECDGMYFVHYGALALVTSTGVEAEHIKDGDHFGEIEMLNPRLNWSSTVVALETSEVLRLERSAFQRVFNSYPPLLIRLQRRAEKRLERLRLASEYSNYQSYNTSFGNQLPL